MREAAANGVLATTVVGDFSDGAIALIDLKADPSVAATIDPGLVVTAPGDDVTAGWYTLPRRVYLDTCTLQAIHKHGDVIWEAEPFVPQGPPKVWRGTTRTSRHYG